MYYIMRRWPSSRKVTIKADVFCAGRQKGWERDLLYRQFYAGMERDLTREEADVIEKIATSEVLGRVQYLIVQ